MQVNDGNPKNLVNQENLVNLVITCKECQMGRLNRRYVTYITWLGDEMITVPDFPAWICDMCGARIYDGQALNRLSLLLSPNAGRPTLRPSSLIKPVRVKKPHGTRPE